MKYVILFFYYMMSFIFKRDFNFIDLFTVGILWKANLGWTDPSFYLILLGGLLVSATGYHVYELMKAQIE